MSATETEEGEAGEARAAENVCAWCGIAAVDNITLEDCDGCDLVKYCGDKCREEHRERHDEECKRRAQQLHDKKLFRQPDGTHLGECPLCFLPMPLHPSKSTFKSCCSKHICDGCEYPNHFEIGTLVPNSLPTSPRLPPNRHFSADSLLAAKLGSSVMFFLQK